MASRELIGKEKQDMATKTVKYSKTHIAELPNDLSVLYRIVTAIAVFALVASVSLMPRAARAQDGVLVLYTGTTSLGGFNVPDLISPNAFVNEIFNLNEESFLALNGEYAAIVSPGDIGILRLFDEDSGLEFFRFSNDVLLFPDRNATVMRRIKVDDDADLRIETDGGFIRFYTDLDNNTSQTDIGRWFNNGTQLANRVWQIDVAGNLDIDGTLTENTSFDLAESFLKAAPVEPGDVVRVDPRQGDAVVRSDRAYDRAAIGVVSTRPGVVLGGGVFSVERLVENWGDEVAALFRREQAAYEKEAFEAHPELRALAARVESISAFADASSLTPVRGQELKPVDQERLQASYEEERIEYADELEGAALDLFFARTFVPITLAGRVPVKVDASFGAIEPGDPLTASPTPGVAMKATRPGAVIGTALESWSAGSGKIRVLVQRGWYGGDAGEHRRGASSLRPELDPQRAALADSLADKEAELAELWERLAALESIVQLLRPEPLSVASR